MNRKKLGAAVVLIVCLCMVGSCYFTYERTIGLLRDEYENELRIESGMISSSIDNHFLRPITVAETVSKDVTMERIIKSSTKEEAEAIETEAGEYLKSIRDGFGYAMVYAVSDETMAFFTEDGISGYLDPDNDERDHWYTAYQEKETEKIYQLNVDTDEIKDWELSVFINTGVFDKEGRFIGLCGVGVNMNEIQSMVERFERIYDVKVDLIDKNGLIMVDSDITRIQKDVIEIDDLTLYSDGECYFEIGESGTRTITYMDELGWYLVVQNQGAMDTGIYSLLMPSIIIFMIGIILIIAVFVFQRISDNRRINK